MGGESIQTRGRGYALDVAPGDVDALRFVELLDAADADPATERDRILAALELWRGTPLMDVQSDRLVDEERPRLVERYLSAVERRIDLDLAAGRAAEVVAEARRVAGQYPLRESTWARLIVALDRSGRTAEALECYEVVRSRIADELGVDPGPELRRIYADLLRGETSKPAITSSDSPPAGATVPRQLPADITPFTGRADALAALDDLLDEPDSSGRSVVALHGPGGTGKTTLAVHWGHRVTDRFPDGQVYVNLQGFGPGEPVSPADALEELLRGLGVSSEQLPDEVTARSSLLRTSLAARRVLMVLDNARDVEQVRPLLPGSGASFVVVTSRRQLRGLAAREGAGRVAVDTLPLGDATDLLVAGLDRAEVAHDEETLTELAKLCGCLPLALAVAVERAGRYSESDLADLVDELRAERDRLDGLDTGDDPLSNVRAVLSWSYQALGDETARLFRLLGLHVGSDISLPAATALAGLARAGARRELDRLVDLHLVEVTRAGRYAMHDLVRTYSAELAAREGSAYLDAANRRLLSWYVHSADRANTKLVFGRESRFIDVGAPEPGAEPLEFADYQEARDWFDTEWPTLVRVVLHAADDGSPQAAYRLVNKLFSYFYKHRPLDEAIELQEVARRAAAESGQRMDEGFITNLLGISYGRLGEFETCLRELERARDLFQAEQHFVGESAVLGNLGSAYRVMGRLADARQSLERALELRRATAGGDVPTVLINLSTVHLDAERPADALTAASEAVRQLAGSGHRQDEAAAIEVLGLAHAALRNYADAEDCLCRAIAIHRELDNRWDEAVDLLHLGRVQRDLERPSEARTSWQEALAIVDEVGELDPTDLTRTELVELVELIDSLDDA